jgi:hypothetical protein
MLFFIFAAVTIYLYLAAAPVRAAEASQVYFIFRQCLCKPPDACNTFCLAAQFYKVSSADVYNFSRPTFSKPSKKKTAQKGQPIIKTKPAISKQP